MNSQKKIKLDTENNNSNNKNTDCKLLVFYIEGQYAKHKMPTVITCQLIDVVPSRGERLQITAGNTKSGRKEVCVCLCEGWGWGTRHALGAIGRGEHGDIFCLPAALPLQLGLDEASESPHSTAEVYGAALLPSNSSPGVFGPLLEAEMANSHHSL